MGEGKQVAVITETNEWKKFKNIKISKKGYKSFFSSKNEQCEIERCIVWRENITENDNTWYKSMERFIFSHKTIEKATILQLFLKKENKLL